MTVWTTNLIAISPLPVNTQTHTHTNMMSGSNCSHFLRQNLLKHLKYRVLHLHSLPPRVLWSNTGAQWNTALLPSVQWQCREANVAWSCVAKVKHQISGECMAKSLPWCQDEDDDQVRLCLQQRQVQLIYPSLLRLRNLKRFLFYPTLGVIIVMNSEQFVDTDPRKDLSAVQIIL